jgi:hypothetical protein
MHSPPSGSRCRSYFDDPAEYRREFSIRVCLFDAASCRILVPVDGDVWDWQIANPAQFIDLFSSSIETNGTFRSIDEQARCDTAVTTRERRRASTHARGFPHHFQDGVLGDF